MCSYYKLMEVCNIETGKLDANAMVKDGAYPFYTCDRKPYRIGSYAFDCECVLIGGNNASGNFPINYYNGKFNAYQRTYVITLKDNVDINIRYIFHALKLELLKIKKRSRGSLTKFLTIGLLENIMLPKLNKNEYEEISTQIDSYDKLIEENALLIKNLEEYSQLLFHKWFIDFNFPDKNGDPYKDAGGEMVEVDGKMIPKGWEKTNIGNISSNFDSQRIPLSEPERSTRRGIYPYYGATKIMDYINEYIYDGDYCLIAEDGSVIDENNKPIMQYATGKIWVNNHAHVLQGNNVSTEYLYLSLSVTNVIQAVTGAIQKKINQQNLNRLPALLPTDSALKEFDNIIKPIFSKIKLLKKENQLLEETRDLLIKKLIK